MKIPIKTTHKTLANGQKRVYYWTPLGKQYWVNDGGPVIKPYPKAFVDAYQSALASEGVQNSGYMNQIIADYFDSSEFRKKAARTQEDHQRHLRAFAKIYGTATLNKIEHRKFRGLVSEWHNKKAKTSPKQADNALNALSACFGYALSTARLSVNPCKGLRRAYVSGGVKPPWAIDEIELFLNRASVVEARTFNLALHTGLRRRDLSMLGWDAWRGNHIVWATSKSRRRRTVTIPLLPEGEAFLQRTKELQSQSKLGLQRTVLVGEMGRSLTESTVGRHVTKVAREIGVAKTLHQVRNTYATELVRAGFPHKEIAQIMGWDIQDVEELVRLYVKTEEIISAQILRFSEHNKNGTNKP